MVNSALTFLSRLSWHFSSPQNSIPSCSAAVNTQNRPLCYDFCVGMIAFFTSYVFGLFMVKEALMSFLTGQLIPLSFFPGVIQRIFDFLPFSSMIYAPVMIYLGKYQGTQLAWVLLRQAVWVLILYGLGTLIWNRVTKRLVVLGG